MIFCAECGTQIPENAGFCPECGTQATGASPEAPETPARPDKLDVGMPTLGGLETLSDTRRSRGDTAPATLEAGSRFADRYVIEEILGAGGMGVVYRAQDTLVQKTVALKLIRPDRLANEEELQKLIAEGVTARDIRHSNVVAVYDVGEFEGQPFLSMECLEGRSLRAWHRAQREAGREIPFGVATRVILEIASGLEAAHAAGVIHRDLKPENIFLTADPTEDQASLKIVDFGIARAAGSGTESGSAIGTPRYMAPEQITNPDLAGPEADLYSLSVIFYELLVDVLPHGHWQPPSGGRSEVPTAIDQLIEKGLSNRPANRPQSASSYAEALASGTGTHLGQRVLDEVRKRWTWNAWGGLSKKQRRVWIGVAIAIVILAALEPVIQELGSESSTEWSPNGPRQPGTNVGHLEIPDEPVDPKPNRNLELTELTGRWYDGFGGALDVFVDGRGFVSGGGMTPDGFPYTIEGQIRGKRLNYTLGINGYISARGSGRWDGKSHLTYNTKNLDGTPNLSGTFHVNHANPTSDCP